MAIPPQSGVRSYLLRKVHTRTTSGYTQFALAAEENLATADRKQNVIRAVRIFVHPFTGRSIYSQEPATCNFQLPTDIRERRPATETRDRRPPTHRDRCVGRNSNNNNDKIAQETQQAGDDTCTVQTKHKGNEMGIVTACMQPCIMIYQRNFWEPATAAIAALGGMATTTTRSIKKTQQTGGDACTVHPEKRQGK